MLFFAIFGIVPALTWLDLILALRRGRTRVWPFGVGFERGSQPAFFWLHVGLTALVLTLATQFLVSMVWRDMTPPG